jgi:hypothetical protein
MRRLTAFALVLAAALGFSALTAAGASAKPPKLVMYSITSVEEPLAPGDEFDMVLYHWSETEGVGPNSFYIETSTGTATCPGTEYPFSGLEGKTLTNGEVSDTVEMTTNEGTLAGGTLCSNTSVLGTEALMAMHPKGAILKLSGGKGKTELKAKSSTEPIVIEDLYSGGAYCQYTASKLKGTLSFAEFEKIGFPGAKQMVLTFTKSKIKLHKEGSSEGCDKHTTVSASFGFQDRGEGAEFGEGLFILGKLV